MADLISYVIAKRVSDRLRKEGFDHCTPHQVQAVANDGESLEDSALESAVLQELEALGLHDG